MSQLVRLEGKHTYQNAHCALVPSLLFERANVTIFTILNILFIIVQADLKTLKVLKCKGNG